MPRKRVIIESPYAGDTEANIDYARQALRDSLSRGEAPFASHLLYTQVLRDFVPHERLLGIEAGHAWYAGAELQAFYTDLGWSPGMRQAFRLGRTKMLPYEYRALRGPVEPFGEEESND